uniref:Taste receptor type 2 n=2 Tax=Varanus komodoensis TaxID=61221 RepID=A0A8D2IM20_VARKO
SIKGLPSLIWFYLIILTTMVVVGLMGNGFITLANGCAWVGNKALPPCDVIVMALSASRLVFLALIQAVHCVFFIDLKLRYLPTALIFIWAFLNAFTTWMATCLAVFYCMKIVNFTKPFLEKIKLSISSMVPHMLLGSFLASLVASLSFICMRFFPQHCNRTMILLSGSNQTCSVWTPWTSYSYIIGTSPAFIIFLICSVFLINSLLHHVKKLKQNKDGFRDQRMDVHVRAVKTFISFLILYSATFSSMVSMTLLYSELAVALSKIAVIAFHSGHSVVLVLTNTRLKQALGKALCGAMGHSGRETASSSCPKTSIESCPS